MFGLLACCFGCLDDDLAPPSIVKSWRVLAVVAEPPEARPGEDVLMHALVVTPDGVDVATPADHGVRVRYRACLTSERTGALSGLTYEPEQLDAGCEGAGPTRALDLTPESVGIGATLPGALTLTLFDRIDELAPLLGESLGGELPGELLVAALAQVGLPLTVQVTVEDGATGAPLVRAFKRVVISQRDPGGSNPPPPRFEVGTASVSGALGSFACAAGDPAAPPRVPRDTSITLTPSGDDDSWREPYFVIDVRGQVVESRERPFYSWFSTGGRFDEEVTVAPARAERWRTPTLPGTYPLWLVVRDGHGGTSACRADVQVE